MITSSDRDRLRREMRARRRALPAQDALDAARRFAALASRQRLLRPQMHIAIYFRHGAEADLAHLIVAARRRGCILYAPVITCYRRSRMRFVRIDPASPLRINRYGILEPDAAKGFIPVQQLDLIFAPLIAVDERGSRIGSGAGFYDRSLQRLRSPRRWRRPRVIGVCYEFQRVPHLDAAPWDVPLDALLTEQNFYPLKPAKKGLS